MVASAQCGQSQPGTPSLQKQLPQPSCTEPLARLTETHMGLCDSPITRQRFLKTSILIQRKPFCHYHQEALKSFLGKKCFSPKSTGLTTFVPLFQEISSSLKTFSEEICIYREVAILIQWIQLLTH